MATKYKSETGETILVLDSSDRNETGKKTPFGKLSVCDFKVSIKEWAEANMVIHNHVDCKKTSVLKNRYGIQGKVCPKSK